MSAHPIQPQPGAVFDVRPFPFRRHVACVPDEDGEYDNVPCWKPGAEWEEYSEYTELTAHGEGALRLHVVSVHKPGRYPTRVFYRREWVDPDGKVFGRADLRVCVLSAFRRRAVRYLHEYVVRDPQAAQPRKAESL